MHGLLQGTAAGPGAAAIVAAALAGLGRILAPDVPGARRPRSPSRRSIGPWRRSARGAARPGGRLARDAGPFVAPCRRLSARRPLPVISDLISRELSASFSTPNCPTAKLVAGQEDPDGIPRPQDERSSTMTGSALAFPTPASLGSLDHYIQAVNRFPLLTAEQEQALARRWRQDEDVDAARQMVMSHLRLVVAISRNYMGYGLPQGDLIQEGNVGLMKAVRRFDPDRGVRLVSLRAALDQGRDPRVHPAQLAPGQGRDDQGAAQAVLQPAQHEDLGARADAPTRRRRSRASSTSSRRRSSRWRRACPGRDIALDPTPGDDDEPSYAPIAWLTDGDDEPAQILERKQTEQGRTEGLKRALNKLDARSRRIIEARWLKETDPATLQQLADEYGVSAERIRQIESKALKQMRGAFAAGRVTLVNRSHDKTPASRRRFLFRPPIRRPPSLP